MNEERFQRQIDFTVELDKMTGVSRRTLLLDKSRRENDAEHSWHIAAMSLVFGEYMAQKADEERAASLCVAHDMIEIYAGDTFAFDKEGNKTKAAREKHAADKLFAILPGEQGKKMRSLWEEFEAMETPESRLANCMDRLQPFIHNTLTDGHTWREAKASASDARARMDPVKKFMPGVWPWVERKIADAVARGWLLDG